MSSKKSFDAQAPGPLLIPTFLIISPVFLEITLQEGGLSPGHIYLSYPSRRHCTLNTRELNIRLIHLHRVCTILRCHRSLRLHRQRLPMPFHILELADLQIVDWMMPSTHK